MEMRKITHEEIKLLDEFCRKKDVIYVDLRLEMIDHLADSIEELWLENPQLSFPKALQTVYKRFGIFGFLDVVGEHQNKMTKRYLHLFWKTILDVIAWPRIVGFVLFTLALYQSMVQFYSMRQVGLGMLVLVSVVGIYYNVKQYLHNKKILENEFTVLMRSPILGIIWSGYILLQIIPRPNIWSADKLDSSWAPLAITIFVVGSILFFLASFIIQYKTQDELVELRKRMA
jgi:TRAP-type C4-dicarboxylate transport system permease small subunit